MTHQTRRGLRAALSAALLLVVLIAGVLYALTPTASTAAERTSIPASDSTQAAATRVIAGDLAATGSSPDASTVHYLHNPWHQRIYKSQPQTARTPPSDQHWAASFLAWLQARFAWLWGGGDDTPLVGTVYVHAAPTEAQQGLPAWALLGEYDSGSAHGHGSTEYIWLPTPDGAILVGIVRNGQVELAQAVHTDHIGTPRLITDADQRTVWQWSYSAFGANAPTGALTPSLQSTEPTQEMNLRFAGQYYDRETGMVNNWHRTQDPGTGRFLQPDPVGIAGGENPFIYGNNNALQFTDPEGLTPKGLARNALDNKLLDGGGACGGSGGFGQGGWFGGIRGGAGAAKAGSNFANEIGILRDAAKGKGNFGLGSASRSEAEALGRSWVGAGYKTARDGQTLVSQDGLRQYRPPSTKPNSPYATTGTQANFERRWVPEGRWQSNGHLDVTP